MNEPRQKVKKEREREREDTYKVTVSPIVHVPT